MDSHREPTNRQEFGDSMEKTDSPGFNFCSWGPGFGGKLRAEYGEAHLFIVDGPITVLYPWLGIQLPILQFILVLS
jgi:hypothetical protein